VADQRPDTNIELALPKQKRCFDVFLYNEGGILDFLDTAAACRLLRLWVRVLLILCYLVGKFLDLPVPLAEDVPRLATLVVSIWGRTIAGSIVLRDVDLDPVVGPEDLPQVLATVEHVDANATVEASWLEKP